MFHFICCCPQSISFVSSTTVHLIYFIYHNACHSHLPYLVALISQRDSTLFWLSLFRQFSVEFNDLGVSLGKVLILDRYLLLETDACLVVLLLLDSFFKIRNTAIPWIIRVANYIGKCCKYCKCGLMFPLDIRHCVGQFTSIIIIFSKADGM